MPPHRRRPTPRTGQAPPIRRPKVAGLRRRPDEAAEPTTEETTEQTAIAEEPEPEETGNVSAVLDGVLGVPPKKDTDRDTDTETAEAPAPADEEDAGEEAEEEAPAASRPAASRPVAKAGTRPAGKRRAAGVARPDDLAGAETDAGAGSRPRRAGGGDRPTRTRGQRQISVAIVLAVVAVVLAGLAVFFRGQTDDLTSVDSNTALTDSAATSQVKGQLSNAIKQTFSYNYTDLDATEKAVKENLTGKALCEYNLLFGEVKQYAPKQKIVLDTTVRELAVVRIDGDRAEALVYIDQLSTRVDVNKTVAVGGQFAVQAAKDGDHWKITEFDMFGQPLFNGKPAPKC